MPGPDVAVIARAPPQPAPNTIPIAASSSSACTIAAFFRPACRIDAVTIAQRDERFAQRRRGRDRIPRRHRAAAHHAAQRRGAVPVHEGDSPRSFRASGSSTKRSRLGRCSRAYSSPALHRLQIGDDGLGLRAELLGERRLRSSLRRCPANAASTPTYSMLVMYLRSAPSLRGGLGQIHRTAPDSRRCRRGTSRLPPDRSLRARSRPPGFRLATLLFARSPG